MTKKNNKTTTYKRYDVYVNNLLNNKYTDNLILSLIHFGYSIKYDLTKQELLIQGLSASNIIHIEYNSTYEITIETDVDMLNYDKYVVYKENLCLGLAHSGEYVYESGMNRNHICFITDNVKIDDSI